MTISTVISICSVAAALIFCAVGGVIWRVDAFAKMNHPLVRRFPHISRTFGIIMIVFSLLWLAGMLSAMLL